VRERIPIQLAAIGPRNVAMAAEMAEGWQTLFFHPDKATEVYGPALAEGLARRDPALGPLDILAAAPFAITDDPVPMLDGHRAMLALYIGGMGAREVNFSNQLARRYGYEQAATTIQDLYLSGRRSEAAAAVPDDLVRDTCLVGPAGHVKERLATYAAAGVTTLVVSPLAPTHGGRVRAVSELRALADEI